MDLHASHLNQTPNNLFFNPKDQQARAAKGMPYDVKTKAIRAIKREGTRSSRV